MAPCRSCAPVAFLILAVALTAWRYAPIADVAYLYDDARVVTIGSAPAPLALPPSRTLTMRSYAWTVAAMGGADARVLHLQNVGIHLVNGVLVYAVAASVVGAPAAAGAAAVFLLHPINSQAVGVISGRADLLMTLFVLLATAAALRARVWLWPVAVAALVAAGMSKEIGLVGVPLAALTLLAWRPPSPVATSFMCASIIGAAATVGASWANVSNWLVAGYEGTALSMPAYIEWQLVALWRLLAMVPWPDGFSIDHDFTNLSVTWQVSALMLTGLAIVAIGLTWRLVPVIAWSLLWVLLSVAPRLVFDTADLLTEPQLYLGMVGVSVLVGVGVACLLRSPAAVSADGDDSLTQFWGDGRHQWHIPTMHGGAQ